MVDKKQFIQEKLKVYGTKKKGVKTFQIQRRMSTSGNPQKHMIQQK